MGDPKQLVLCLPGGRAIGVTESGLPTIDQSANSSRRQFFARAASTIAATALSTVSIQPAAGSLVALDAAKLSDEFRGQVAALQDADGALKFAEAEYDRKDELNLAWKKKNPSLIGALDEIGSEEIGQHRLVGIRRHVGTTYIPSWF